NAGGGDLFRRRIDVANGFADVDGDRLARVLDVGARAAVVELRHLGLRLRADVEHRGAAVEADGPGREVVAADLAERFAVAGRRERAGRISGDRIDVLGAAGETG